VLGLVDGSEMLAWSRLTRGPAAEANERARMILGAFWVAPVEILSLLPSASVIVDAPAPFRFFKPESKESGSDERLVVLSSLLFSEGAGATSIAVLSASASSSMTSSGTAV